MKLTKNKFNEAITSMESASFSSEDIHGDITVSQEGITDVFKGIGELWKNWRLSRINKRPKLSVKDLEKIHIWAWSIKRQIKKTYGEKRWVMQKIDGDKAEIEMSEFAKTMTLANTGKIATFAELTDNMVSATETIFSMYEHIEKYIGIVSKDVNYAYSPRTAYEEIEKIVNMMGTPEQLVEKQTKLLPSLPGNLIIEKVTNGTTGAYGAVESKKPIGQLETLPALSESEFVGFSTRVCKLIDSMTDNNFFNDEIFFTREYFVEKLYVRDQYGNTYNTSAGDVFYNAILKIAHQERNSSVVQALSPDFWNLAVSDLVFGITALNLDLLKCELEYLNRHLKD